MAGKFDNLMRDAKVEVPPSGEFRRLNRALLKERILVHRSRNRRRKQIGISLFTMACSLFILISVPQWNINFPPTNPFTGAGEDLDSSSVSSEIFRGQSLDVRGGVVLADEEETRNLEEDPASVLARVRGLSWGGKTSWSTYYESTASGQRKVWKGFSRDPVSQVPEGWEEFMKNHRYDLRKRQQSHAPDRKEIRTIDGVLVQFKIWYIEFPDIGEVTVYEGVPLQ